jgi:hypothetical protein
MHAEIATQVVTVPGAIMTALSPGGHQASLAGWYGEPLVAADAEALCAGAQKQLRVCLCAGQPVFSVQLLQLLAHFWMDVSVALEYQQLTASATGQRDRALLEIVYGQLLLSRRQWPAVQHLDRGFSLATDYLAATDYFLLVRRHELLRHIPLSSVRAAPQGLQSLLAEAAVIRELKGVGRHPCSLSHQDTIG